MSTFAFGSEFTVGMEEELLLVDPATLQLAPVAGDVLEAMHAHPEDAGHEAYAAQIELRSPPAESASDAAVELAGLRTAALEAGATLMASGLHPTGRFGDAELVPTERYARVGGRDARDPPADAGVGAPRARRHARRGERAFAPSTRSVASFRSCSA